MQDRFKFRVWIEKYKKIVDVNSFGINGGVCEWVNHDNIYPTDDGKPILNEWGAADERQEVIKRTKLAECVLEQCTGLKDKNGNLIYAGDIVKIPDDYEKYGFMASELREVYFKDGGFRLKPKRDDVGRGHWLEDTEELEIVGNIHADKNILGFS